MVATNSRGFGRENGLDELSRLARCRGTLGRGTAGARVTYSHLCIACISLIVGYRVQLARADRAG